jgi:hypothetical protein
MHRDNFSFYFTLTEVVYIAMTFFHRRFKNLHQFPNNFKTVLNRYSISVTESKKLISIMVHDF